MKYGKLSIIYNQNANNSIKLSDYQWLFYYPEYIVLYIRYHNEYYNMILELDDGSIHDVKINTPCNWINKEENCDNNLDAFHIYQARIGRLGLLINSFYNKNDNNISLKRIKTVAIDCKYCSIFNNYNKFNYDKLKSFCYNCIYSYNDKEVFGLLKMDSPKNAIYTYIAYDEEVLSLNDVKNLIMQIFVMNVK